MASYQLPGGPRVEGTGERVVMVPGWGAWQDTTVVGGANTIDLLSSVFSLSGEDADNSSFVTFNTSSFSFDSEAVAQSLWGSLTTTQFDLDGVSVNFKSSLEILSASLGINASDFDIQNITAGQIDLLASAFGISPQSVRTQIQAQLLSTAFDISPTDIPFISLVSRLGAASFGVDIESVETPFVLSLNDFALNEVIYLKLQSLGYGGTLNEMLLHFFLDNGATSTDLDDAERQWLLTVTDEKLSTQDMYYTYLTGLGYTGTINELIKAYWVNLSGEMPS